MKQTNQRSLGRLVRRAAAAVLLGQVVAPAAAQVELDLELPVPEVSVIADTRRLELTWPEVAPPAGRAVTNIRYFGFDASSSVVQLTGVDDYVLDCDFRLNIGKIPSEGFQATVDFVYRLQLNTSGVGAPFAIDTLTVFRPDSVHYFDPTLAGNIGVTCSANYDQPGSPLGTVPVTVGGLNSGQSQAATMRVSYVGSGPVSFPGSPLLVRVVGPYVSAPNPATLDTLITVTQAGTPLRIQNGMTLTFGSGSTAPGDSTTWTVHYLFPATAHIEADLQAFEGYHVWRYDLPAVDRDSTLIGEIRQCESKFEFYLLNEEEFSETDIDLRYDPIAGRFTMIDRDVHDDFPYRYAVSTFDRGFLGNNVGVTFEGELAMTPKVYPSLPTRDTSRRAFVVPNPYKRTAAWQEGEPKVVFANLPAQCTIRIFTVAADHVATLHHGPTEPRSTTPTSTTWDLVSDSGKVIAPGIYIFYIESPDGFQQTGKMIVAR